MSYRMENKYVPKASIWHINKTKIKINFYIKKKKKILK